MRAGLLVSVFLLWFSLAINVPGCWGKGNLLKNEKWDFSLGPVREGLFSFLCFLLLFSLFLVGFDTGGTQLLMIYTRTLAFIQRSNFIEP